MALVIIIYHTVANRTSQNRSLLFLIALWICFEKLHLGWEFSWPWLNLGNGFSEYITWIQWYEYTGTFGGTLWVLLTNTLVFTSILKYNQEKSKQIIKVAVLKTSLLISIPILVSFIIFKTYTIMKIGGTI